MKDREKFYVDGLHVPLSTPEKQELEEASHDERKPMTHIMRELLSEYLRERRRQKRHHQHHQ